MMPVKDSGIYEAFVPGLASGQLTVCHHNRQRKILFKADPYAFTAEYRPGTASVTTDIRGFNWSDSSWMENE